MKAKVSLWNPWILIPAGVSTLLTRLIFYLIELSRRKRYTGEATAEILEVKRSSHYSNGRSRHVYTPTVVYTIDGSRYESKGQGSGRSDYYTAGAQIPIRYNVNKPEKCLTIPEKDSKRGACFTMLIGLGIGLLGAIAMFT